MFNKYKNFIFDLDGTLINSSEEILKCLNKSFKNVGYAVDEGLFVPEVIGPPLKQIIASVAPELKDDVIIEQVVKNFRRIYDYDDNDESLPYSGIEDLIERLRGQDRQLYIATFKPFIPTQRIIAKFFNNKFEDVYTIDKFDRSITKSEMLSDIINKYNLKIEETVMIGDSVSDIMAAKDVGIDSIGVLWGYGKDKRGLIENSNVVVNDVLELMPL